MPKLWGGRFAGETDELVARYNASLPFDVRLVDEDIDGSIAWARALVGAGARRERTARLVEGWRRCEWPSSPARPPRRATMTSTRRSIRDDGRRWRHHTAARATTRWLPISACG